MTEWCIFYLALYINGGFAAEARNSTFSEGVLGLAAATYNEDTDTAVRFDNLIVTGARLGK